MRTQTEYITFDCIDKQKTTHYIVHMVLKQCRRPGAPGNRNKKMSKLQTISADVLYYNTEWNPVQNIDVKIWDDRNQDCYGTADLTSKDGKTSITFPWKINYTSMVCGDDDMLEISIVGTPELNLPTQAETSLPLLEVMEELDMIIGISAQIRNHWIHNTPPILEQ